MDDLELTDQELEEWKAKLADLWKQRDKLAAEQGPRKHDPELEEEIKFLTERVEAAAILKMKKGEDPKGVKPTDEDQAVNPTGEAKGEG